MIMPHSNNIISPIEKIISVLSYVTMGIAGLLWLILAYFLKKKLRYFLMYNIAQSMIIAIILAIFKLLTDIILSLIAKISFLDFIMAIFNLVISFKIIRISNSGISFTILELLLLMLLGYIIFGILFGKIFYIPNISDFMKKVMKNYK